MPSQKDLIKSISYDQEEILEWIMKLYCPDGFECDPTYSKGNFYKSGRIPQPKYKFDIEPYDDRVSYADARNIHVSIPFKLQSIIFDPPFIWSPGKKRGCIVKRFGCFETVYDIWDFYKESLNEFYKILRNDGFLIFKCQDGVKHGKQYLSHIKICNQAIDLGFYPKDLFILLSNNRIVGKGGWNQKHARKYHSYFIVFQKKKVNIPY